MRKEKNTFRKDAGCGPPVQGIKKKERELLERGKPWGHRAFEKPKVKKSGNSGEKGDQPSLGRFVLRGGLDRLSRRKGRATHGDSMFQRPRRHRGDWAGASQTGKVGGGATLMRWAESD